MAKRKSWFKLVEAHGIKVQLVERGSVIHRRVNLGRAVSAAGKPYTKRDERSLGHGDRTRAIDEAKALCAELASARLNGARPDRLTLGQLFMTYRRHRLPALSVPRQNEARARIAMFTEAWTADLSVADVDQTRVDAYVKARRSLVIVAPGKRPRQDGDSRRGYSRPRPIGDGGLDAEFRWLSSVFNWGRGFRMNGRRLLGENPLDGVAWPKEKNPRRPVASHQRFTATLERADAIDPMGRLHCILSLARFTGRRESALCSLHADDLLLSGERIRDALAAAGMDERLAEHMPNGAIRWRDETDKQGFLFISPMSRHARGAVDAYLRCNPRMGSVPLFPAPGIKIGRRRRQLDIEPASEKPIRRETAAGWLLRAEKLAGMPKLAGGVFHPYRRLWASERKHLPDVDVPAAGGWKDTQALRLSYQHADPATVLRVVEAG